MQPQNCPELQKWKLIWENLTFHTKCSRILPSAPFLQWKQRSLIKALVTWASQRQALLKQTPFEITQEKGIPQVKRTPCVTSPEPSSVSELQIDHSHHTALISQVRLGQLRAIHQAHPHPLCIGDRSVERCYKQGCRVHISWTIISYWLIAWSSCSGILGY